MQRHTRRTRPHGSRRKNYASGLFIGGAARPVALYWTVRRDLRHDVERAFSGQRVGDRAIHPAYGKLRGELIELIDPITDETMIRSGGRAFDLLYAAFEQSDLF